MNINSLKEIIQNITVIYENLNQLADRKTKALKENEIKTLDSIMQQEEVYNKKILQLLQARDEFFSNYGQTSESDSKEIEQVSKRLMEASNEFSKKNEINQTLVKQSLYYINMNINMLTPQNQSDTYSPKNKKSSEKPNRVFMDSKV
ncbi:flagellar protein FlgN (plasmid) [Rossellomorea sp. AcN35-11]|nr:flagellar protein FlgN [Rossellomorea aquimaris]WJV32342.1 flagellar protein FlgN [Rossellomorea sp. AcN35-11]